MDHDTSAQEGGAAALECGGHRRFRAIWTGERRIGFAFVLPLPLRFELLRIFLKAQDA
ncbi:hypothetical protein [Luteolibacter sp. Populi]|uniref:hypothetical protein n=1 Tax=Luteolibacter sp. Populi TaxID=3230487 RepID=UPI0034658C19